MRMHVNLLALVLFLLPGVVFAQGGPSDVSKTGTVAAPFLEIPVGASAVGMGTAFVSLANDPTALYWNPAGVAALQNNELTAAHMGWIAETRFDFAALVLPLGDFGTLGISYTSLSMDDMKVRTVELPEGTGEYFSAGDIAAGVSYARKLSERFSVGFTAKYIHQTIWHETASAFALDFGTLFRTDLLGGMVIGASLSNFGTSMELSGRDLRQFVRIDPTKLGSNEQIPTDVETESWDLPLLFQLGVSTSPLRGDDYRWTVAVDALHPSDNYESVNLGTELAYRDFLFLRGGYHSLFLDQAEGGLSLGFGVTSSMLFAATAQVKIDYAYRDMGRLEGVHIVSLGVRF
jgi:hypothetical protein